MNFKELNIIAPILQAIEEEGYTTATPIQTQAIPLLLEGRDVLGCAQTGTGKTAAFSIPMLQILSKRQQEKGKRNIKSLILTPTRELAIQIGDSLDAYGRHLHLRNTVIFGGVNQNKQITALAAGIDILVATPGRLLDLISQGFIRLDHIDFFVLDEADRMLDMGFVHDVNRILKLLPSNRQNLFFSATMAPEILTLANAILRNPVKVEVTPVSSTVEKISQSVYFVDRGNKNDLLVDILNNSAAETVLVFSRTKHGCDKIVRHVSKYGIKSDAIHGNKSQNNRQRALSNFKSKDIRVLVATDIAARGIDVEGMELVINYDLPNVSETYVHRIGRTGRAGKDGQAISFSDYEEKAFLKDIEKLTRQQIPVINDHPYPMEVFEIPKKSERPPRQKRGIESKNGFKGVNNNHPAKPQRPQAATENRHKKKWYGKRDRA
ncbi:DEAD/DEAH box helicase [Niabella yanshanensis]|uniref:DEAD/DEAH box helicase n=1 Tax=Niabella yanshanensis TaxID=577386 RepID=A0ABZ0W4Q7_9BACT|nr:DEAD/DEAH box helicase [Niabella yanshanensis]WQD37618.1 DEAD/DEAH box helicase [Niabella yanshanensis]